MDAFLVKRDRSVGNKHSLDAGGDANDGSLDRFSKNKRTDMTPSIPTLWKPLGEGKTVLARHYGALPNAAKSLRVAAFDMDGTLIDTKREGNSFPVDRHDWKFLRENVASVISSLHAKGYMIVIFSNQAGVGKNIMGGKRSIELQAKIGLLRDAIGNDLPLTVFMATQKDRYRKPEPGMWRLLQSLFPSATTKGSFFVGDAAGRPQDHSDADKKFAANAGLRFFLPEQVYDEEQSFWASVDDTV